MPKNEAETRIMPKDEAQEIDVPSEIMYSKNFNGNVVATSSGSSIRSSFIGMGFSQSLVDKVIDENGEDNVDLLLETLFTYSALQKTKSQSSDSLDELFSDIKPGCISPEFEAESHHKQEPDIFNNDNDDRRESLLMMKFSVDEIDFALAKLGKDASVVDLVDFIAAAQISKDGEQYKIDNTEALYGTMNTTLRLLEMGFSENEVSLAIDKFGSEVPISDLAEYIFRQRNFDACGEDDKSLISMKLHQLRSERDNPSFGTTMAGNLKRRLDVPVLKKPSEQHSFNHPSYTEKKIQSGKKPKPDTIRNSIPVWNEDLKPRLTTSSTPWLDNDDDKSEITKLPPIPSSDSVSKLPYFFYGSVVEVSPETWTKILQFLYGSKPEYVNTQAYSVLRRAERYVHNLPTENRFRILPAPELSLRDAIPGAKRWWPEWDTREKLNHIRHEPESAARACARVAAMLSDPRRALCTDRKNEIVRECWDWNLVWRGAREVGPVVGEELERVLGYPRRHFPAGSSEGWLGSCFQTDTLGFHLSGLAGLFPAGVTVLSLFSGAGGAEVCLRRLGVRLRAVVSVEGCDAGRGILRRWWEETGQTGELVQIDDIRKLGRARLEGFVERFGGFDLVMCRNRCGFDANGKATPFDFSLFVEFVRVLKVVRSIMTVNFG